MHYNIEHIFLKKIGLFDKLEAHINKTQQHSVKNNSKNIKQDVMEICQKYFNFDRLSITNVYYYDLLPFCISFKSQANKVF